MKSHFNQSLTKVNKIKRELTTATTASWDINQQWSVLQSLFDVSRALSFSPEPLLWTWDRSATRHLHDITHRRFYSAWTQRWATTVQPLPSNAEDFTIPPPSPPSPPSPPAPRDQSRPTHHFIIYLFFWFRTSELRIQFLINIRAQHLFSLTLLNPRVHILFINGELKLFRFVSRSGEANPADHLSEIRGVQEMERFSSIAYYSDFRHPLSNYPQPPTPKSFSNKSISRRTSSLNGACPLFTNYTPLLQINQPQNLLLQQLTSHPHHSCQIPLLLTK